MALTNGPLCPASASTGNHNGAVGRVLCRVVTAGLFAGLLLVAQGQPAQAVDRFDNSYCYSCHDADSKPVTLPSGDILDVAVPSAAYDASVHGQLEIPCVLCHTTIGAFPHQRLEVSAREFTVQMGTACAMCHSEFYGERADLDHLYEVQAGNLDAPVCSDCHGAHDIHRADDPASPVSEANVVATCQSCHPDANAAFVNAWDGHPTPVTAVAHREEAVVRGLLIKIGVGVAVLVLLLAGFWLVSRTRGGRS